MEKIKTMLMSRVTKNSMKLFFTIMLQTGFCHYASAQKTIDMSGQINNAFYSNSLTNPLDSFLSKQEIDDLSSAKTASFESLGGTNRFFAANWLKGGAVSYQNKIESDDKYRYNYDFITHQLFARLGGQIIAVNPDHLRLIYMTDEAKTYTFCKFPAIGVNDFEELLSTDTVAGKLKFIKQRNVVVINYTQASASTALTGDKSDIYQNVVNYFIVFPDNTAVKIKLTSKSFMEALKPEYQVRAKELMGSYKKMNEENLTKWVNDINAH